MNVFDHAHNTVSTASRKRSSWLAAGGIGLALVIAGCGSTYGSNESRGSSVTPPATHATNALSAPTSPSMTTGAPASPAPTAEGVGIPQNGGGDHDSDNNGGPSDGDGNV
jgi:hypothetical protein